MLSVITGDPPFTGDLKEHLRTVSDAAVAMARRLDDPATLGFALVCRNLRTLLHSPDERLAIGNEIIDLATATEDLSLLAWGWLAKHKVLCQRGNIAEARRTLSERAELAQRLHMPFFSWTVAVDEAMVAFGAGRFADAEQWIDRADDIQPVSGVATFQRITLRREQGRVDELMPLVDRLGLVNFHPRYGGIYDAFQLICQLETGQRNAVREEFERRASGGFADRSFVLRSLSLVAEVCAEIQDTDRARLLYERLLPDACLNVHIELSDLTGGSVSYYLGLLATTMSRWDDAERHFADALAMNQEWGTHVYVAYTRYAWADILVRRGRSSDRERAWDLLGQARTAAEEMGMVRLLKLIDALEGRMGKPETRYPAGLTPREVEVLRLISQGMTDAEAAECLYLSPRTISTHLTSIYNKLGVNSRAAATRFAVENGLT
jgi:DNA-binding CsgD family transcriptional regulator